MKKNTLVIASGGFFGFKLNGKEQPLGLVRSNGKRLVNLIPWDHGGVLVSDQNGHAKVIPASNRNQAGAWSDALQSKPIIINSGKVDVAKNLRDAEFNRVAIGFTREEISFSWGHFKLSGKLPRWSILQRSTKGSLKIVACRFTERWLWMEGRVLKSLFQRSSADSAIPDAHISPTR